MCRNMKCEKRENGSRREPSSRVACQLVCVLRTIPAPVIL